MLNNVVDGIDVSFHVWWWILIHAPQPSVQGNGCDGLKSEMAAVHQKIVHLKLISFHLGKDLTAGGLSSKLYKAYGLGHIAVVKYG